MATHVHQDVPDVLDVVHVHLHALTDVLDVLAVLRRAVQDALGVQLIVRELAQRVVVLLVVLPVMEIVPEHVMVLQKLQCNIN